MRLNKKYVLIFMFIFAIQVMDGCSNDDSGRSVDNNTSIADLMASINIQHIAKPVSAPDFELLSVNDERVGLSRYRGKVILLSFWATW